jgi:porin
MKLSKRILAALATVPLALPLGGAEVLAQSGSMVRSDSMGYPVVQPTVDPHHHDTVDPFVFDSCDCHEPETAGCGTACGTGCGCATSPKHGGRDTVLGDVFGLRPALADHGITVDADVTQWYMGVTNGGLQREFRYAGHGDYVVNVAGKQLGLNEGFFLKLRAEHRFGESLGGATGALLPSNVLADLPVVDSEDLFLTNVLVTQALSENFAVFVGKLDTLDGDANAFAHGRGKTQFSNIAFVANPIVLRAVPYSTLGGGFVVLQEGEPVFTYTLLNATDTASTSGFDELFRDGLSMSGELRVPTQFFDRPGHQLLGVAWSNKEYVALGQDPRIVLPNIPVSRESGSWAVYYNFDQYLVVDPCDPKKGWGLFGRAGIADEQTNPISYFLSLGIGGQSLLASRPDDTFGIGWYYSGTSGDIAPLVDRVLGGFNDGQGVECYYDIAVTKYLNVTPDMQVIIPAREQLDTAFIVGARANLKF